MPTWCSSMPIFQLKFGEALAIKVNTTEKLNMVIVNPGDEAFLTYDWYPHKFGQPITIDHKSSWTYVQLSMEATRSDWTEDNELSGEAVKTIISF